MSKTHLRRAAITAALIATAAIPATAPATAAAAPTITISGSTSVAPLASLLARGYIRACDRCVGFRILQGGSDVGINDVSHGRVTIGMSSRDPKDGDQGLVFKKIAKDALCVTVNQRNGQLFNMSRATVQAVFGGSVRDWSQVPGSARTGTIDVLVRTAASGTQDAFLKLFMKKANGSTVPVFAGASQKASNGLIQQAVQRNANAIGYVSLAFTDGTHPLKFEGVPCTLRTAANGTYQGARFFYFVTRGAPTGAAARWIRWILNSRAADRIVATNWVPYDP